MQIYNKDISQNVGLEIQKERKRIWQTNFFLRGKNDIARSNICNEINTSNLMLKTFKKILSKYFNLLRNFD